MNRWYNLPARLEKVVERLRGVRVENRDARELLEMFADRPATLMYLDPPYHTKRKHGYVIDAKDRQFHVDLLALCQKATCMLLVSGYQNDLYDEVLTAEMGWKKLAIETYTRNTTGTDFRRTEILWMNVHYQRAKRDDRIPIRLNKEEIEQNKLNPSRKR